MSKDYRNAIIHVFCQVLEDLAFMFGDPLDGSEMPEEHDGLLYARLRFHGEFAGLVELIAPAEMSQELAENVLGISPEQLSLDNVSEDALGELLNVTCGQLITELAGEDPVMDLCPPQVQPTSAETWERMRADPQAVGFMVDEHPVMIRLTIDGK